MLTSSLTEFIINNIDFFFYVYMYIYLVIKN